MGRHDTARTNAGQMVTQTIVDVQVSGSSPGCAGFGPPPSEFTVRLHYHSAAAWGPKSFMEQLSRRRVNPPPPPPPDPPLLRSNACLVKPRPQRGGGAAGDQRGPMPADSRERVPTPHVSTTRIGMQEHKRRGSREHLSGGDPLWYTTCALHA